MTSTENSLERGTRQESRGFDTGCESQDLKPPKRCAPLQPFRLSGVFSSFERSTRHVKDPGDRFGQVKSVSYLLETDTTRPRSGRRPATVLSTASLTVGAWRVANPSAPPPWEHPAVIYCGDVFAGPRHLWPKTTAKQPRSRLFRSLLVRLWHSGQRDHLCLASSFSRASCPQRSSAWLLPLERTDMSCDRHSSWFSRRTFATRRSAWLLQVDFSTLRHLRFALLSATGT